MAITIHIIAVLCLEGQHLQLGLHHSSAQFVTLSHLYSVKFSWYPPPWVPLRKKQVKFQRSNGIVFKLKKGNMTWRCIQTARGWTDVLNNRQACGNPWNWMTMAVPTHLGSEWVLSSHWGCRGKRDSHRRQTTKSLCELKSYDMFKAGWGTNHEHEITAVPRLSQRRRGNWTPSTFSPITFWGHLITLTAGQKQHHGLGYFQGLHFLPSILSKSSDL